MPAFHNTLSSDYNIAVACDVGFSNWSDRTSSVTIDIMSVSHYVCRVVPLDLCADVAGSAVMRTGNAIGFVKIVVRKFLLPSFWFRILWPLLLPAIAWFAC